ncbi:7730_t:CDS:1, partial [Rhizophagus irregularis]
GKKSKMGKGLTVIVAGTLLLDDDDPCWHGRKPNPFVILLKGRS